MRAASNNVTSDINSSVAVETLLRRFNHLIDCIGRVKGGLSNENHPDILHPMRKDLRKEEKTGYKAFLSLFLLFFLLN